MPATQPAPRAEKQPMEIKLAHSPDSDDAFMFYALATNRVKAAVRADWRDIRRQSCRWMTRSHARSPLDTARGSATRGDLRPLPRAHPEFPVADPRRRTEPTDLEQLPGTPTARPRPSATGSGFLRQPPYARFPAGSRARRRDRRARSAADGSYRPSSRSESRAAAGGTRAWWRAVD